MKNNFRLVLLTLSVFFVLNACKKSSSSTPATPPPIKNNLVYIYKNDSTDGVSFENLLKLNGCTVTLINKSAAAALDYSSYSMIIIGGNSDTLKSHDNWDTAAANKIKNSGKPCLLIGEGGLLFGGAIGDTVAWLQSAGNFLTGFKAIDPTSSLYKQPNVISVPADSTITLYSAASEVGSFYLKAPPLANVTLLARETGVAASKYYPMTIDNVKYATFGYYDNMDKMTAGGKAFFVNLVYFAGNLTQ